MQVSGAAAADLLAKLCPIDIEAMRTGESAATLAGPFNVQVVKAGDEEFRLYVFRSFGLAMWEMLLDEAAEFGGEIVAAVDGLIGRTPHRVRSLRIRLRAPTSGAVSTARQPVDPVLFWATRDLRPCGANPRICGNKPDAMVKHGPAR